ncbi:hypothetical protein WJX84_008447 [Apatococcus fuscideae]|uniref:tRNA pseudouridine synthase n=1 Tax=Apatococcus fuscideae TaxID=2026836 RepID=A0AAW1THY7_9CHLO
MYIGYVGTGFSGLQVQPDQPDSITVESVLQAALTKAELISQSNSVSLTKVGWSRSSRTDKGVHSICTIISFKMELSLEAAASFGDEGLKVAARTNEFLPEQVRVFAVHSANRSFNARSYCVQRTYHYYMPASVLGLQGNGCREDDQVLSRLRACLKTFEGSRAFHNYTKRRLYRLPVRPPKPAQAAGDSDNTPIGASAVVPSSQDQRALQFSYQDDWGPGDKLGSAHYRIIREVAASDILQLTPGGTPCIRLTFCANSFVLHQIRHMVATAAAVALGSIPMEFVEASLSPCCRTITPISPPQTLVLVDAKNSCFPMSEERLELQQGGKAAQERFYSKTVQPALSSMLESSEWSLWRSELARITYSNEAMEVLLSQHQAWVAAKPVPPTHGQLPQPA